MHHQRILLCLIILGVSNCSPVFAESSTSNASSHSGGWHLGMTVGPNVINTEQDNNQKSRSTFSYTLNNRSDSTELYLGYDWLLSPRWLLGVEGGYQNLGASDWRRDYNSNSLLFKNKYSALDALFTTTYWLTEKLALLGKVGVAYEVIDQTASCNSGDCSDFGLFITGMSDTRYNVNPEIMAGLGWQFASQWQANFLYQRIISNAIFSVGNSSNPQGTYNNPTISSFLLGLDYQMTRSPWVPSASFVPHLGGWHVGMTLGPNVIDTQQYNHIDDDQDVSYTLNNRSLSAGLYVGYDWSMFPRWLLGVEGGYQDLGSSEWQQVATTGRNNALFKNYYSALDVLFTTTYWLTDKVALLAKVGAAYEVINQTLNSDRPSQVQPALPNGSVADTRYNINPELAAGLSWQFAPQWQADFLYQRIISNAIFNYGPNYQQGTYNNPTISSFLLGLDYQMTRSPWVPSASYVPHLGGWHVGMTLGPNVIDTQQYNHIDDFDSVHSTLNNRSLSAGLYVGYDWSMFPRWLLGVEGGYQDLGVSKWEKVFTPSSYYALFKNHYSALDVLFTTAYWLTDKVALLAKAGAAYEVINQTGSYNDDSRVAANLPPVSLADTRYNINPELAAGFSWQFAPQWQADFLYQRIISNAIFGYGPNYQQGTYNNPTISSFLLGLDYQMTNSVWVPSMGHDDHFGGWHVGVTAGSNVIDTQQSGSNDNSSTTNYTLNNRSISAGLYMGYDWSILPRWLVGVDGGYQDLGSSDWRIDAPTIGDSLHFINKYSAIDLLLTTTYWLTDKLAFVGKIGAAYEVIRQTGNCRGGDCIVFQLSNSLNSTRYNINPELAAGLSWQFAPQWQADFLYQRIISNAIFGYGPFYLRGTYNNPTISSLLLGLDYQMTQNQWVPRASYAPHLGGWHVGVAVGTNVIDTQEFGSNDNLAMLRFTLNNRSVSKEFYLGYDWSILPRWLLGVEVGYQDLGIKEGREDNAIVDDSVLNRDKYSAASLLLTTTYWLTHNVAVLGKMGAAYEIIHQTLTCSSGDCTPYFLPSAGLADTRYNVDPEIAGGLGWQFATHWQTKMLYERLIGTNKKASYNPSISSFLIGVDYKF